jgi:AcrR family transcriptional regulator
MTYLRKRPRQERSQVTFEAIVEAAARILAEEGERALKTNHVAERAGVSIGSLYQYFPDRKAIVRALMEREAAHAAALRPAAIDDPTRPRSERLRALVDWYFDVHSANPSLWRALGALVAEVLPADDVRAFRELRHRRAAATITSLLAPHGHAENAVFIVETCLDALSDRALERAPDSLRSERLRVEVAALLEAYLERGAS